MKKWNEAYLLAQRNLVINIYSLSKFEGVKVELSEIENIIKIGHASDVDEFDINVILNLKRGWQYILNNPITSFNTEYIKTINAIVAKNQSLVAGEFRDIKNSSTVSGVDKPILQITNNDKKLNLDQINQISDPKLKAYEYLAFGITSQMFWDGNKRTSFLAANGLLIAENVGILNIKPENLNTFNKALAKYYNEKTEINKLYLFEILDQNIELSSIYSFLNYESNMEL